MIKELWLRLIQTLNQPSNLNAVYGFSTTKFEQFPFAILRPSNASTQVQSFCSKEGVITFEVTIFSKIDSDETLPQRLASETAFIETVDQINELIDKMQVSDLCVSNLERIDSDFGIREIAGIEGRACVIQLQAVNNFNVK